MGPISILASDIEQPPLLAESGYIQLLPSMYYDNLHPDSVRLWCHHNARYGLPTVELIDWLKKELRDRSAIEIGAGCGDLCHYLGITGTDSKQQTFPPVADFYKKIGQPIIKYPEAVVQMDAAEAIKEYQPDVVIGSWVTQWIDPNLPFPEDGGNFMGIKEDEIVESGITYILIGNESVHGSKKIMREPHAEFKYPFIRSRSSRPHLNRIWIWNR